MKKFITILLAIVFLLSAINFNLAEEKNKDFYLTEFKDYINESTPFDITEYIGQNLLLSFWTTWCPYCIQEMPDFVKFKNEFKDDVRILMIHVPDREDFKKAEEFFKKHEYSDSLELLSDNGFYAQSFGVQGFPTNIVFDSEGKLVHYGYASSYDDLKNIFEKNNLFKKETKEK